MGRGRYDDDRGYYDRYSGRYQDSGDSGTGYAIATAIRPSASSSSR